MVCWQKRQAKAVLFRFSESSNSGSLGNDLSPERVFGNHYKSGEDILADAYEWRLEANEIRNSILLDELQDKYSARKGISENSNENSTKKENVPLVSKWSYSKLEKDWYRVENGQKIINKEKCLAHLKGKNSCAIRFSYAANSAGYKIPINGGNGYRVTKAKPGDSGNFITGAYEVKNYLSTIEAPTVSQLNITTADEVDKLISKIHDKTSYGRAIMVIVAGDQKIYGASGHVDLLYRDFMQDISMYGNNGNDLGPYLKSRLTSKLSVYIWKISK